MLAAAILMKDPASAKTRLRPALDDGARERLAILMFENTLSFLARTSGIDRLVVVTPSPCIARLADAAGIETVHDDGTRGINGAADMAVAWAKTAGATRLLLFHADVPALLASEIASLLTAAQTHPVVVAASRDGGTNALLLSPPDAIPCRFGLGSAQAHEREAHRAGLSCAKLFLENLSHDIDTPGDLAQISEAHIFAVPGLPEFAEGDDVGSAILAALCTIGERMEPGDIVAVAQKIVSKTEGRMYPLSAFAPSPEAERIAAEIGKDAHKVEAALRESQSVVRTRRQSPEGLLITRHRLGWICANAGIDQSNLGMDKEEMLLLLPEDPDASAARIRRVLETEAKGDVGVIVTDTFGRPWRHGLLNVAIGVAGVPAVVDWSTKSDAYGRNLRATVPAFADEIAAASGLLMQKNASTPVVIIRGLHWDVDEFSTASCLLRDLEQELFL